MTEDSLLLLEETEEGMNNSVDHLQKELLKIRTGKASPTIFDGVKVEYYGASTPISQVANINIPDAKTIVIQPWDRSALPAIEKAVINANLGFTPVNNGEILRINLPPLTEERRREMVKKVKVEGENGKIAVRNIRRNSLEQSKKLEKGGVAEDEIKGLEKDIQAATDAAIEKIDKIIADKEKEIMTV